jgi:hypothetical protein
VFTGTVGFAGVITIELRFAAALLIVRMAEAATDPEVAVMIAEPDVFAVARPAVSIVATLVSDEAHCTELVTSFVLPSDMSAVALNCWVAPGAIAARLGEIWMDEMVAEPDPPPFDEPPVPPPCKLFPPPLLAAPPQAVSKPQRNKSTAHRLAFIPSPK